MGKQVIFTDGTYWKAIPEEFIKDINILSGNAVKIYLYFAMQINIEKNNDEHVWPTISDICKAIGITRRNSVSTAITELVERGWIAEIKNPKIFNFQNNYTINHIRKVNKKLVNSRHKKSKEMSDLAKERKNNLEKGRFNSDTLEDSNLILITEGSIKSESPSSIKNESSDSINSDTRNI